VKHSLRALVVASICFTATIASAQTDDDYAPAHRDFSSPEWIGLELRIGPYVPQVGNDSFQRVFADDKGLMLALELDVVGYRLRDIAYFSVGAGIGQARYSGGAFGITGARVDEETSFKLIPMTLLAVLRVDALARKLSIPLVLTGKLGYRWGYWTTSTGSTNDADGMSTGIAWGLQAALDLDFFDLRAARVMDEEWGINHSYLFVELYGSKTSGKSLPVGDTTWTAGLGFIL
jgi:hypothetical protein